MKDHPRLLGSLFLAWAVAQVIVLVVALAAAPYQGAIPAFFWLTLVLSALAYGSVGYLLRRRAPQARVPAIVLSALALLSFPIGTALGIYGLWTLLRPLARCAPAREPPAAPASAVRLLGPRPGRGPSSPRRMVPSVTVTTFAPARCTPCAEPSRSPPCGAFPSGCTTPSCSCCPSWPSSSARPSAAPPSPPTSPPSASWATPCSGAWDSPWPSSSPCSSTSWPTPSTPCARAARSPTSPC